MTYLDVVTGFLGAGKTTFLVRYTRWLEKQNIRYCVIENEFGRAGVDGALLSKQGARVKEISGGCVCCTLKVTLHDLIEEFSGQVDRIILEPSGLFCGDDLMDILKSPGCTVRPGMWLGVVDPLSLPLLNGDDIAVLQSELMQAGSIVVSKVQLCGSGEAEMLHSVLSDLLPDPQPACWTQPWDNLSDDEWFPALQACSTVERPHERRTFDHMSMFQSAVFSPERIYNETDIDTVLKALTDGRCGNVLRAKGVLSAQNGQWQVNASPGCILAKPSDSDGSPMLNVIGRGLDRRRIRSILEELK